MKFLVWNPNKFTQIWFREPSQDEWVEVLFVILKNIRFRFLRKTTKIVWPSKFSSQQIDNLENQYIFRSYWSETPLSEYDVSKFNRTIQHPIANFFSPIYYSHTCVYIWWERSAFSSISAFFIYREGKCLRDGSLRESNCRRGSEEN